MRSFEEIPDIAERIKRSKMELQESGFYLAPEWDSQSCCDQDYVNNFKKGWESRQTEVDELQKQVTDLDNRATKYALDAMATAKLNAELQKRVDELQTAFKQLIEMENESISFEHDLFDKGWNQSARQTIENIYKLTGLGEQALKGEQP